MKGVMQRPSTVSTMLFSTLNKQVKGDKSVSTVAKSGGKFMKPSYKEGSLFPSYVQINLVSSQRLVRFKESRGEKTSRQEAIRFSMDELREMYSD